MLTIHSVVVLVVELPRDVPTYVQVVVVEDMRHDQRWPQFRARAIAAGVRSQLGIQLYADDRVIGGLNMYSTSTDTLSGDAIFEAELFATHAAIALGRARREDQLNKALSTRLTIGQAVWGAHAVLPDRL